MGVVYSAPGNYSLAYKYLQDGVELIKIENQRRKQKSEPQIEMEPMRGLQHLGNLERSWGNFAKALDHYEEAVRVGREAWAKPFDVKLPFNQAYLVDLLVDLGTLYGQLRQYDQAQATFQEALDRSAEKVARSRAFPCGAGNIPRSVRPQPSTGHAAVDGADAVEPGRPCS
jgi:tetratricopeptide (TPR) repeat protein